MVSLFMLRAGAKHEQTWEKFMDLKLASAALYVCMCVYRPACDILSQHTFLCVESIVYEPEKD